MKKVMVFGVGAMGSAAALRLDGEPSIEEIICADIDQEALDSIVGKLKKARGVRLDAHDLEGTIQTAEGVDLILNALPLECTKNVLDAALTVKANYQDYAGANDLDRMWVESERFDPEKEPEFWDASTLGWWRSLKALYEIYGPKFRQAGRLALFGTGSAPGLICVATRYAMRYLDQCDTIYNFVWEGAIAKRFQPFWWSPITALGDMSINAVALEDGALVNTPPFGRPITRRYPEMPCRITFRITFREHCHDEPMQYSFNARERFKGCRNAYFKYAGPGMDLCRPLFEAGLLSHEEEVFNGQHIVPFDFVLSHLPNAPKYDDEIKSFVDEGLALDSGCMVIEAYGRKDGRDVLVEVHVNAPGFVESYERAGMTGEMYLTGQGGYLFSKMLINGFFEGETGVMGSDGLSDSQVDQYLAYAAGLGITLQTVIKKPWEVMT